MAELKNGERLKMRNWLEQVINSGKFPGVEWTDERRCKFRVPWKHASRQGWDVEKDASIFKMWAVYTGKFPDDCRGLSKTEMRKLAKVWKANFRCALNALQDIQSVRGEGKSKGTDAFKVFQILPRKAKSRTVRLSSQGSEEGSLTIKIRRPRSTTTAKRYRRSPKSYEDETDRHFYPQQEHNYSDAWPTFKMTNGSEEMETPQNFESQLTLPNNNQDINMFNATDHTNNFYAHEKTYSSSSSDDLDTSSNESDIEYASGADLVAQLIASPGYDLSTLNINQTISECNNDNASEAVCHQLSSPQQVINLKYQSGNFNNNMMPFPAMPNLMPLAIQSNIHFKEGATDPFCGGFDARDFSSFPLAFKV
eukprot:gene12309-13579_t